MALLLAGTWAGPCVLVDADPAGGDVAGRLPGAAHDAGRGLVALAADLRRSEPVVDLTRYQQRLPAGLALVIGLRSSDQAAALDGAWPQLATALKSAACDLDVIVDCGRLDTASRAGPLWRTADLVIAVARPEPESLAHLRRALRWLVVDMPTATTMLVLPLTPSERLPLRDVARAVEGAGLSAPVRVARPIVATPRDLDVLYGRRAGRLEQTLLVRSARQMSTALRAAIGTPEPDADREATAWPTSVC